MPLLSCPEQWKSAFGTHRKVNKAEAENRETIYTQSDDLMETEEIKSQADLDPTPECSEQMNATDTTVSFKLTYNEIDDMKLSIAYRMLI